MFLILGLIILLFVTMVFEIKIEFQINWKISFRNWINKILRKKLFKDINEQSGNYIIVPIEIEEYQTSQFIQIGKKED